jgi:hypothetical protein
MDAPYDRGPGYGCRTVPARTLSEGVKRFEKRSDRVIRVTLDAIIRHSRPAERLQEPTNAILAATDTYSAAWTFEACWTRPRRQRMEPPVLWAVDGHRLFAPPPLAGIVFQSTRCDYVVSNGTVSDYRARVGQTSSATQCSPPAVR